MEFQFAYPLHYWLPAAVLTLACAGFMLRRLERRRRGRLERFVAEGLASRLLVGYDGAVRRPLFWLSLAGFGFVALSLAQPHWGQSWQNVTRQSRDILIVLDTSHSMLADDLRPDRLTRAKYKISTLMDRMPGDRFGLIVFAGGAALQCPPTADHGYFRAVLDAVDTYTISLVGTDIAAALEEATKLFREQDRSSALFSRENRAILLISDGENVSGDALVAAEAAARHARIYSMGIGDPRGVEIRIPEHLARHVAGADRTHFSRLDEDSLIRIATAGNGRYVRSEADDWDIDRIHEFMEKVAARSIDSDVRLRLVNRFQWPLAVAIGCFAAEGAWWICMPWIRRWRSREHAEGDSRHA